MFFHKPKILTGIILLSFFSGCIPASKLGENEYLLVKNEIIIAEEKPSNDALSKIEQKRNKLLNQLSGNVISDYIQQKPNTKMLGLFQFHLAVYNFTNRRQRKGKESKKKNKTEEFEDKIKKIIGEPPVILDSLLTIKSKKQLGLYLFSKGYFNTDIKDSVIYKKRKKDAGGKATVHYHILSGKRYNIKTIDYEISDSGINAVLKQDDEKNLLRKGMNYDEDLLDKERTRLVRKLKNAGYFYINNNDIKYIADTSLGKCNIGLTIRIEKAINTNDSLLLNKANHIRYTISNIYINTDFNPNFNKEFNDTLEFLNYLFLRNRKTEKIKPDRDQFIKYKTITRKVFLKRGKLFKIEDLENTYKHLSALQIFKYINIQFSPGNRDNELNCIIHLSPVPKQSFLIETEGTNSAGNLGIAENFIYRTKNLMKGAELFELAVKGGLEAQNTFGGSKGQTVEPLDIFNTIEIGTTAKIFFPKLIFPIKEEMIPKRYNPRTSLSASYNYQQRSDYIRTVANFSFGYEWNEGKQKTHILYPFDLSSVKLDDNSLILDTINFITNDIIRNSFTDHFIASLRYSFIFSDQQLNKKTNFNYFKGNLELAGNLLSYFNKFSNTLIDSSDNSYRIFGIKYAQYSKVDLDWRHYIFINQHSTLIFRIASGLGLPYGNSNVMPFERSFFAGGANGIRGWQARELGPGSYQGPSNFDQIGDIKIEGNIESRFEFIGVLEGAAFIDAGNIWLTHEDSERPGAMFKGSEFYNEIAIGTGLGIRLNYNYFIIRLDASIPVKDPSKPMGSRWVIGNSSFNKINYNLGIGYPF